MKDMKTILTMVLLVLGTTVLYASETNVQAAKKNLHEDIGEIFNNDLKQRQNYFYENDISAFKEDVEIKLYVDEAQNVKVLQVVTENLDAEEYVKSIFRTKNIKADKMLSGMALRVKLHLKYKAF